MMTDAAEVRTEYQVTFKAKDGIAYTSGPHEDEVIARNLADLWRERVELYGYTDIEVQFRHVEVGEWEKA